MNETECPQCQWAETPRVQRITKTIRMALFGMTTREVIEFQRKTQADWLRVAMGKSVGPTWYQRHKDAFEKDGNVLELERMLRHVKMEGE